MAVSLSARQFTGPRKGTPWSAAEIEILREMRQAGHPAPAIARRLGRTVGAVYAEARKAGSIVMARKPWTDEEAGQLRSLHEKGYSEALIAENLGRTPASVRAKVEMLGLTPAAKADEPRSRRTATVCRRTVSIRRAPVPGEGNSWKQGEIDALFSMSGKVTLREASERIGRPIGGVRAKAKQLGVVFVIPRKDLGPRDERLAALWSEMQGANAAERIRMIADQLGISRSTVVVRAARLGLRQRRQRRRFDDAARAEIIHLAPEMTASAIARRTGWDLRTVRRVAAEESLVFAAPEPRPAKVKTLPKSEVAVKEKAQAKGRTTASKARAQKKADSIRSVSREAGPARAAATRVVPIAAKEAAIGKPKSVAKIRQPPALTSAHAPMAEKPPAAPMVKPPEMKQGPEERLQMMREVLRKMKRKGYFPADSLTGS